MKTIKVLKPFVEGRSGRQYKPGDVVTDPTWHAPDSRRAEAYAGRGMVQVVDQPDIPAPVAEPVIVAAPEGDE